MKKGESNLTGNARYEGFCIDLLKDVANLVGFQYTIEAVEDGKYGVEDPVTKEWNGVVKELIHGVSLFWIHIMPNFLSSLPSLPPNSLPKTQPSLSHCCRSQTWQLGP
jgi:hypothetical protein